MDLNETYARIGEYIKSRPSETYAQIGSTLGRARKTAAGRPRGRPARA